MVGPARPGAGFTLVELLMVLSVVAFLGFIATDYYHNQADPIHGAADLGRYYDEARSALTRMSRDVRESMGHFEVGEDRLVIGADGATQTVYRLVDHRGDRWLVGEGWSGGRLTGRVFLTASLETLQLEAGDETLEITLAYARPQETGRSQALASTTVHWMGDTR